MVRVMTVTGEVTGDPQGTAAVGERLIGRLPVPRPKRATDSAFYDRPVSIERLGELMVGRANRDDAVLEPEHARRELERFAGAGGGLVVEVTGPDEGRDRDGLRRLSEATGVHIVAAATAGDQDLAAELTTGGAGLIAVPEHVDDDTRERAYAAAVATGAPVLMDASPRRAASRLCAAIDAGLPAERVGVRPVEASSTDLDALREVSAAGAYLLLDGLGRIPTVHTRVSDHDVAAMIARLVGSGSGDRIMIGAGLARKHAFTAFGGHGLPFLPGQFLPYLRMLGVSAEQAEHIGGTNAWCFLGRKDAR